MISVVSGAPGSGKSTFVEDRASEQAVILDYDLLAEALGSRVDHRERDHYSQHLEVARVAWIAVRSHIIEYGVALLGEVWIIHSFPAEWHLREYRRIGARIFELAGGRGRPVSDERSIVRLT